MKVKAIIPASGYGIRMNLSSNISKEMLTDPNTGKPLIAHTLELCKRFDLEPVVITRKSKQDLILYCSNKTELIVLDEAPSEWPGSILAAQKAWGDHNILLLPDTRFSPIECLESVIMSLKQPSIEFVFASHKVDNLSQFGMIEYQKDTKQLLVCEKPKITTSGNAWGIIGFKNNGKSVNLFNVYSERNKFLYLKNFDIVNLTNFKDITRNGKIE